SKFGTSRCPFFFTSVILMRCIRRSVGRLQPTAKKHVETLARQENVSIRTMMSQFAPMCGGRLHVKETQKNKKP
ncbi:MAG: hypothetical protein RBS95_10625, partial [Desulfobulbus sp.]|nr:hypothetical protein [Desulfobulbus sp.]